jgi:protein-S-isoprenylcysteine O-methyltransferase Ste14
MGAIYPILLGLCLLGLAVRCCYEALKKGDRIDTKNKAVFAAVFSGMSLFLASWPFMSCFDPVPLALPGVLRWAGLACVVLGLALVGRAFLELKGLENIEGLVSSGIYAKLRHPMYTGFMLWILGWIAFNGAGASALAGALALAAILWWQRLEEKALEARYGEEYLRYKKGTWF